MTMMMMGRGGGNSKTQSSRLCCSCSLYPGIAVEQVFLAFLIKIAALALALEIVDVVGSPILAYQIPSLNALALHRT